MTEQQRHKEENMLTAPLSSWDDKTYHTYVEVTTLTPIDALEAREDLEYIT